MVLILIPNLVIPVLIRLKIKDSTFSYINAYPVEHIGLDKIDNFGDIINGIVISFSLYQYGYSTVFSRLEYRDMHTANFNSFLWDTEDPAQTRPDSYESLQ